MRRTVVAVAMLAGCAGEAPPDTYLAFGDSITETSRVSDDGAYEPGIRSNWPVFFAPLVGVEAVTDYARSGAAFRDRGLADPWQRVTHQIERASAHGIHASVIIVSAGTNDADSPPETLGTFDAAMGKPPGDLDLGLLYDALRWSFAEIREAWPNARCFAALPIQRADASPEAHATTHGAIRQMAEAHGCRVINATYESGIDRAYEVWGGEGRYLYDGLHPNVDGQKLMAALYARDVTRSP